jgi:hypothetical protein
MRRSDASMPRLASLFVITECFLQMSNYLGGLLEHRLKLRLVYLDYILSQTALFPAKPSAFFGHDSADHVQLH